MDDGHELQRLRDITDEFVYWWDNSAGIRAFFPDQASNRMKSFRDRFDNIRQEYREGGGNG